MWATWITHRQTNLPYFYRIIYNIRPTLIEEGNQVCCKVYLEGFLADQVEKFTFFTGFHQLKWQPTLSKLYWFNDIFYHILWHDSDIVQINLLLLHNYTFQATKILGEKLMQWYDFIFFLFPFRYNLSNGVKIGVDCRINRQYKSHTPSKYRWR